MRTIWKFPVPIMDEFTLTMPENSEILCVKAKGLCDSEMWAIVETDAPLEDITFYVRGTGHDIQDLKKSQYIGTFWLQNGALVFHLFKE